jgi:hypothetical protein
MTQAPMMPASGPSRASQRRARAAGGIGEEIKSVGFESLGLGKVARDHLREKHRAVDGDRRPERALVTWVTEARKRQPTIDSHCRYSEMLAADLTKNC